MSISDTDGSSIDVETQRASVERFGSGWRCPHPHAWDEVLAEDVVLSQPLMPNGVGRAHWQREFARLQAFLPDLRGEVVDWSARGNTVHVEVRCDATVGGRRLSFTALDRLTLSADGQVVARHSYLDPTPLVVALLTRPHSWGRWWRSGIAPLAARRTVTDRPADVSTTARTLGVIRTAVGITALASPRLAHASLNRDDPVSAGGFFARAFGVREVAIATLALAGDPRSVRLGLLLGALADASDATAVLAGRRGVTRTGRWVIGLPAALFAAAGTAALARGTEH